MNELQHLIKLKESILNGSNKSEFVNIYFGDHNQRKDIGYTLRFEAVVDIIDILMKYEDK